MRAARRLRRIRPADLAQFAAGGIGFHRSWRGYHACAVTAPTMAPAAPSPQRRLFVLPVDTARSESAETMAYAGTINVQQLPLPAAQRSS